MTDVYCFSDSETTLEDMGIGLLYVFGDAVHTQARYVMDVIITLFDLIIALFLLSMFAVYMCIVVVVISQIDWRLFSIRTLPKSTLSFHELYPQDESFRLLVCQGLSVWQRLTPEMTIYLSPASSFCHRIEISTFSNYCYWGTNSLIRSKCSEFLKHFCYLDVILRTHISSIFVYSEVAVNSKFHRQLSGHYWN